MDKEKIGRTVNCFATIKNTGKRIQLIKDLELSKMTTSLTHLSLGGPSELPVSPYYHGNRCWSDDELTDIVYEDDPRYIADVESMVLKSEDWTIRAPHYTQRPIVSLD